MKKRVIVLLLILTILLTSKLVFAANETDENETNVPTDKIDKAYACLENQLGDDCAASASTEQTAFSLLAIGYDSSLQSDCRTALENKKQGSCWGTTKTNSCDLKSTSEAILALNHIGKNTDDYVKWILDKRKPSTGLNWFLEIDANEATSCKIKVNNENEKTFTISENKKISGTSTCLTPAESNYFLKISDACLNNNFTISCDKDFITTLLYKKTGDATYYVSSKTHAAPAEGSTEEKVDSYCFGISSCDYEGSLWASLALAKKGEEITSYIPYLSSVSDEIESKKYFPSAFLYMLTNDDDYYTAVTEKQKQGKYWQEEATNSKYYDTSLALLSLQNLALEEVDNAKEYLLTIQDNSGCWNSNNILDTAFILYAAWPKNPVSADTGDGRSNCGSFGYSCVSPAECSSSDTLDNFYCPGLSDVCCSVKPLELSCKDKGGIICETGYECTGSEVPASDTNYCCMASCIAVSGQTECEQYTYTCKSSCSSDEDEKTGYNCNAGDICCAPKTKAAGSWLWIILLVILIILVVLAIIFRNQLKIWLFRFKSKLSFGKGPGPSKRPPMSPMPFPLMRPRQIIPRQYIPIRRPPIRTPIRKTEKDSVFEETMKKLRDMAG